MASAASGARVRSFHRIDAKPSGDSTEYTACSCMATRSASASARAPAAAALAQKHAHHRNAQGRPRPAGCRRWRCPGRAPRPPCRRTRPGCPPGREPARPNFSACAHEAQRLAVALGLRAAEVARDALGQGRALLLRDDRHGTPRRSTRGRATMAPSSPKARSPCSSMKPSTNAVEVARRRGPAHVARQLHGLPGAVARSGLAASPPDLRASRRAMALQLAASNASSALPRGVCRAPEALAHQPAPTRPGCATAPRPPRRRMRSPTARPPSGSSPYVTVLYVSGATAPACLAHRRGR